MQTFPNEPMKKPTLYHAIRVGSLLWNFNYSEDIQIAGLLHDALEDTSMNEEYIKNTFGKEVLNIVTANTKNENLPKDTVLEDIVSRCEQCGINAMIVKVADIYDNFCFYKKQNNLSEIKRCQTLAKFVIQYKHPEWQTPIFEKLDEVMSFKVK